MRVLVPSPVSTLSQQEHMIGQFVLLKYSLEVLQKKANHQRVGTFRDLADDRAGIFARLVA
jgi:hypothetical protein